MVKNLKAILTPSPEDLPPPSDRVSIPLSFFLFLAPNRNPPGLFPLLALCRTLHRSPFLECFRYRAFLNINFWSPSTPHPLDPQVLRFPVPGFGSSVSCLIRWASPDFFCRGPLLFFPLALADVNHMPFPPSSFCSSRESHQNRALPTCADPRFCVYLS